MGFGRKNFGADRVSLVAWLVAASFLWHAAGRSEGRTQPAVTVAEGKVVLENPFVRYTFSTKKGLRLEEIFNKESGNNCVRQPDLSRLFVITSGAWQLDSTKFKVLDVSKTQGEESADAELSMSHQQASLLVNLKVHIDQSSETKWSLKITNQANEAREVNVCFPALGGLQVGEKLEDNHYLYPHEGGWLNHLPVDMKMGWGHAQIQLIDVYNPKSGGGIYVRSNDSQAAYFKTFDLKKVEPGKAPFRYGAADGNTSTDVFNFDAGIGIGIHYLKEKLSPGAAFELPESVIGIHGGDWRGAMQKYREWVLTWYKPHKRPEWWRKCFVWDHATDSPYRDGKYDFLTPVIERNKDPDVLDRVDWISIVNWWQPPYGPNEGDYDYHKEMGGLESFREAVRKAHERGIKISLYMEGFLAGLESRVGKAHGEAWGIMDENGEYSRAYGVWNMCPSVPEWQEHLAATVARLVKDTDADAVYLDSIGMQSSLCYHPSHKHKPGDWFKGVGETLRKVHEAVDNVKSDVVISTEDFSCDVNTQYMDSSLSYAVQGGQYFRSQGIDLNPTGVSLFRFYFPDFKFTEWPLGVWDLPGYRQAFLNGNGILGQFDGKYNELEKACLMAMVRVLRDNRDAFSSLNPVPFIETKIKDVYANKFATDAKVLYTVYNAGKETQAGELLGVEHRDGCHYVELLTHREVEVKTKGGKASLSLDIPPGEVICVAQLPGLLRVEEEGGLKIRIGQKLENLILRIGPVGGSGQWSTKEIRLDNQELLIKPSELFGEGSGYGGVTAQLFGDSYLVDEVTVGARDEIILVEDELPPGAVPEGTWQWDSSLRQTGEKSHTEPEAKESARHSFMGLKQGVPFASTVVQYIYLDSNNAPEQVMIEFKTKEKGWQHCAYWGNNLLVPSWEGYGTPRFYPAGGLPAAGKWVKLEVPSRSVGIEGFEIQGARYSVYGGKANWDRTAILMPRYR